MTDRGQGASRVSSPAPDNALGGLLSRAGQGDEAAFTRLYDRSASRVHGLVRQVVRDAEQAERVSAEVFGEVWRTASRFPVDRDPLAWLLAIAHRRAVAHVRATRRPLARGTSRDATAVNLHGDPALALTYHEAYAVTDVAAALGVSVDVVHQRLRAALLALRPGQAIA